MITLRWSDQIRLITFTEPEKRTNEHGFPSTQTETSSIVFANKKSVGYSEFYKAAQAGYNAEIKLDVYSSEYTGQQIAEYPVDGKRYRVLRSYVHTNGEFAELTLIDLPEAQASINTEESGASGKV